MHLLKQYLSVFKEIYSSRLGKDFSLPLTSQLLQNIGSFCYFGFHLLAFKIIIDKFTFPDWSRADMWVLLSTFEIFTYTAFFLFWKGLNYTVKDINSGSFDLIVAKPISSRLLTFFRGGGSHNLLSVICGIIMLGFVIVTYGIHITAVSVLVYIFCLLISLWIIYCISVSFISLNFKYGRINGTIGVVFQVQEVYKYPAGIYQNLSPVIWLVIVSTALITTVPTALLILKPISPLFLGIYLFTALLSTLIADKAWTAGLRQYSSSG